MPTKQLVGFNYRTLKGESGEEVKRHADAVRILLTRTAQNIMEVGRRLREVNQLVGGSKFRPWLKAEFHWSVGTAYRFMAVADRFAKVKTIDRFDTSALVFLSGRSVPQAAIDEAVERAGNGEFISQERATEIRDNHKVAPVPTPPRDLLSGFREYVQRLAEKLGRNFIAQQLLELAAELQNVEAPAGAES